MCLVPNESVIIQLFSLNIICESKNISNSNEFLSNHANLVDFLENAPRPLHAVLGTGKILWANKFELNVLGYQPEEYIGHDIGEVSCNLKLIRLYSLSLYSVLLFIIMISCL